MAFTKGQSGNPRGRPRGILNQLTLRKAIAADIPDILDALSTRAKEGDVAACKLLLDRVLPSLKPQDEPVRLPLGDDLAASGRAVLAAVGGAAVTPEQGVKLLQGLGSLARVIETEELAKRVEKLEEAAATSGMEG